VADATEAQPPLRGEAATPRSRTQGGRKVRGLVDLRIKERGIYPSLSERTIGLLFSCEGRRCPRL